MGTLRGHTGWIKCLAVSPDGQMLASGAWGSPAFKLWRTAPPEEELLRGHQGGLGAVVYSADGKRLISGSQDGAVKVWDIAGRQEIAHLTDSAGPVWALALTRDGKTLAVGNTGTNVTVWDLPTGRQIAAIPQRSGSLCPVAFSPDGRLLAMGGDASNVHVWNVTAKREVHVFKAPPTSYTGEAASVSGLAFSPDGKILARTGGSTDVTLWDTASWRRIARLTGHTANTNTLAFSPDSRWLATGSADQTVHVWEVASRRTVAILKGHTQEVMWLGFSPDGKRLATTSLDHTLRFWSTSSWLETATLRDPLLFPRVAAFSPDGNSLATGRPDRTIHMWRAPTAAAAEPQARFAVDLRTAEAAAGSGHWSAAIAPLDRLIAQKPEESDFWWRRGWAHAELGQWNQAAADFTRYGELEPGREPLNELMWLCLARGDTAAYRRLYPELLRRVQQNERGGFYLLYACLVPRVVEDTAPVLRVAERILAAQPEEPGALNRLGAAYYRAGRLKDAAQCLQQAVAALDAKEEFYEQLLAEDWLWLAMAEARLGHQAEARRWLDMATRWYDEDLHRKPGDRRAPMDWRSRLPTRMLRAEAEAVVKQTRIGARR